MGKSERPIRKSDFGPKKLQDGHEKSMRRRKVRAERKKFKRNQQPKGPRRKDWTPPGIEPRQFDEWDEVDHESFERIMPIDEGDRRRVLEHAAFARSNLPQPTENSETNIATAPNGHLTHGRVTAIANALCRVALENETLLCHIRGTLHARETGFTNAVAVGDQVLVKPEREGYGVVEQILPRRSILARPDVFYPHLQQIVVANADQLLIVASWRDPIIWFELIDRYLIAAARNELPAIICVNKIDLATSRAECEDDLRPYQTLTIPYLLTSAQSGEGIAELRALLQGRTTVLAGLSGVGKSSLLSAVQPSLNLRVGVVSEHSGDGRHTTTQATLIPLDPETWVVDTPGIREFGLSGLTRSELYTYFPEMAALAPMCRFRNCMHIDEQGCAVQAAVASGAIAASRNHSYRHIYASLPK